MNKFHLFLIILLYIGILIFLFNSLKSCKNNQYIENNQNSKNNQYKDNNRKNTKGERKVRFSDKITQIRIT